MPGPDAARPRAAEKKSGAPILAADEPRSSAGSEADPWWVRAALDLEARQVAAVVAGRRDERTARCLWDALPDAYREGTVFCTDLSPTYRAVLPAERHAAAGKGAGITCHIERFWCTARQRLARFARRTLAFSKCEMNHVGALWNFIRHYNALLM